MARMFKTQFHNGSPDEKVIVTMGVTVNNGKKFHALDKGGRDNLVHCLEDFIKQVKVFKEEVRRMRNK